MKQEFSAGVIVYYEEKSSATIQRVYLLLYYRNKYWDFPKGKLENKETYKEAALRELKEETGLALSLKEGFEQTISYFFKDTDGVLVDKTVVYFVGKADTKNVTLSDEHIDFEWLPLQESISQLTYANAKQVLSMADNFINGNDE
ncbi:NUDIX domain-containing protein [Candidatus Dependentiae bacterium]|nr:NUDIX domain-containing protein [Candidatus Dependentiae bacterium]